MIKIVSYCRNLRLQLSMHNQEDRKRHKNTEKRGDRGAKLISDIFRIDRDLQMVSQCLLSGAGPRVSTTCYTSVTFYLPCRNILHDIFCTLIEFFKRDRVSDDGFTYLIQNFIF